MGAQESASEIYALRIATFTAINSDAYEALLHTSIKEDYRFLLRLKEDWVCGANRFNSEGETLQGAWNGVELVGVCGLNTDPYLGDPATGRLRHLYVARGERHRGVGSALVRQVLKAASGHYRHVRLRTTKSADAFYRKLGFEPVSHELDCTHCFVFLPGLGN